MRRIRTTIELAKASWEVLQADKELLLLPVISFLATLVVGASFLVPIVVVGDGPARVVLAALAYFVLAFVTIFFNAALVEAAYERLSGDDPTLAGALRAAAEHLGQILAWAAVAATVSVILKQLEGRGGLLGSLVSGIAGVAWSLVTFLVIPVLVVEGMPVGAALRRSASLFRRTWGENVAAQVGFGLLGGILGLAALPVVLLAMVSGSPGVLLAGIVLAVVWGLLVAVVVATLSGIFQAALYRYAAEGAAPAGFHAELSTAFASRR